MSKKEKWMDEDRVVNVTSPSIEFLVVLRTEFRHGMQNNLIPGGMEELLKLYWMIPSPITEPLWNYGSLSIDGRKQILIEVGKTLNTEVLGIPGTSSRFLSSKVRCLEEWLDSYQTLARIEREMEREKDRNFHRESDESLGGYSPNFGYQMTTTHSQRERIQQAQDGLRRSLDNSPWF